MHCGWRTDNSGGGQSTGEESFFQAQDDYSYGKSKLVFDISQNSIFSGSIPILSFHHAKFDENTVLGEYCGVLLQLMKVTVTKWSFQGTHLYAASFPHLGWNSVSE